MDDAPLQRPFIREWREFRDLSLEELAQASGMVKGNLSKVERGINPYNQRKLELIARRLECTTADLLGRPPGAAPALEALLQNADPDLRSQISTIAEALLQWRPAPVDALAELEATTREVSTRTRRGRPPKKQKAAG